MSFSGQFTQDEERELISHAMPEEGIYEVEFKNGRTYSSSPSKRFSRKWTGQICYRLTEPQTNPE
jgi:hypothetical protein